MIAAIPFDDAGKPKPPIDPRGGPVVEETPAEMAVEGRRALTTPRCSRALPITLAPIGEPLGGVKSLAS
eukprot:1818784-Pyramimonas_sp.AAC.1